MVYVDTSVFVSILTNESAAAPAAQWLGQEKPGSVFISGWTIAEFSSALSLKLRTRQINHSQRQVAMTAFQRLVAQSLSIVTIDAQH
ncbi:type II toxin-antitoxin system VapC family toxin [Rhizobium sp. FY34]|uniref:type II toxin-antitoxin system VapC family toxin n=1 Tax=Rhizobium sp. FY34 TaxID=2562309 RepID=UPI0010C0EEB1|nr:type II toxin-antitoxin system VapC family toxin [Rhizobium sp. FY34]